MQGIMKASNALPPRVFTKGHLIRFYFQTRTSVEEFSSRWDRHRIPSDGYQVSFGLLRWDQKLPRMPEGERGWREAKVIAGAEWGQLTTNLVEALAPAARGHGISYKGLLADRLMYRDAQGLARDAAIGEQPREVIIDHNLSIEETLATRIRKPE